MTDRDAAWDGVHEALPARWSVGLPSYSPEDNHWIVTAPGPHPRRGKHPQTVSIGEDEIAALRDLDDRIRGVPQPDGGRMDELRRRLRLAYVDGAETWTRESVGRGMRAEELQSVLRCYPGGI